MQKKLIFKRLAVSVVLAAVASNAIAEGYWYPVVKARKAYVVARSATRVLPASYSENYATVVRSANAAYGGMNAKFSSLFENKVRAVVASGGYELISVDGQLVGPLNLNFNWNGSSHDVLIDGIGFKGRAGVKGSFNGVSAECWVTVGIDALRFRGKFDWAQGRVSQIAADDVPVSRGVSCETNLSWIPILGNIADKLAEQLAQSKLDSMGAAKDVLEGGFASDGAFDLSKLIPARSLVDPTSGVDLGAPLYQRNALYPRNNVRIQVQNVRERPPFLYDWWNEWADGMPLPTAQYLVASIDVVGSLRYGLSVSEELSYKGEWRCPAAQPRCSVPQLMPASRSK